MKVLVAMSGGVDSSVAAWLMRERGYECIGVTMKLFSNEDIGAAREHTCCSLEDVEDARSVAYALRMPHYVFNFAARFRQYVVEPFVRAYESGATPNPCIECNRHLKFRELARRAAELGCAYVATGHYARVEQDRCSGRWLLKKAADRSKDQSYFLYTMTQEQLRHTLFPLGELTKPEVRALADRLGLVTARKHDSQDICFIPDGDRGAFLERCTGKRYPGGDFIGPDGRVVGHHKGLPRYTVGQRKGLGIAADEPLYVAAMDRSSNTISLAPREAVYADTVWAEDVNMIAAETLCVPMRVQAKLRSAQAEQWATAEMDGGRLRVRFDEPQWAPAVGQAVVLYDGDTVVGGGTICQVGKGGAEC